MGTQNTRQSMSGRQTRSGGCGGTPSDTNESGLGQNRGQHRAVEDWPDPFHLPAKFSTIDETSDTNSRAVRITPDMVYIQRFVAGVKILLRVPVRDYAGIALQVQLNPDDDKTPLRVNIYLAHQDPGLSILLYSTNDKNNISAYWHGWGRALGLSLILTEYDGSFTFPFSDSGPLLIEQPIARRRRKSHLADRRPRIRYRRELETLQDFMKIFRTKREIIARN